MQGSAVGRSVGLCRALAAIVISSAFLWAVGLSVSPQWHERIHSGANRSHHQCVITLVAAGTYYHLPAGPLIGVPAPRLQFSELATLNFSWIPSLFLGARIFEHAPPASS
jgi:hypothetical protein